MATEVNISELNFGLDQFNKPNTHEGLEALAKLILNLIVTIPGAVPSNPEMGLGIERYKQEFNTPSLHQSIKEELSRQINKYFSEYSSFIKTIVVEDVPVHHLNNDRKAIYIGLILNKLNSNGQDAAIIFKNALTSDNNVVTTYIIDN